MWHGKYVIQDSQADHSLIQPHGSLILHILGDVINCDTDKRTLLSVGEKTNEQRNKQTKKPALTFLHAQHAILLLKQR